MKDDHDPHGFGLRQSVRRGAAQPSIFVTSRSGMSLTRFNFEFMRVTGGKYSMNGMKKLQLTLDRANKRDFFYRDVVADRGVIKQIFFQEDYNLTRFRRHDSIVRTYNDICRHSRVPLIIDAGANIGASVVWFQNAFPKSHVLAFEPEQNNFSLLKRNCVGLNVDARLSALGAADARANIMNPDGEPWAFRMDEANTGSVEVTSISRCIEEKSSDGYEPFIVKIDIEGGEKELFSRNIDWIQRVPLLIIELHDWLFPREGTSQTFLSAISQLDRDFVYSGENIFSFRN